MIVLMAAIAMDNMAQQDTTVLDDVVVESDRDSALDFYENSTTRHIEPGQLGIAPAASPEMMIDVLSGVDMRSRGVPGVQSDISLRGGSHEQTLVLLNGIPLNDPQTGHHNMNLPIAMDDVAGIAISEGPASLKWGGRAFSGAVNFSTPVPDSTWAAVRLATGSYGYQRLHASASYKGTGAGHYLSMHYSGADAYRKNTDYEKKGFYYRLNWPMGDEQVNFDLGYQDRAFGANSFYSASFPEQYEEVNTLFGSLSFKSKGVQWGHRASLYSRVHWDHFRLKRYEPDFYTNNHRTLIAGFQYEGHYHSDYGTTRLTANLRNEHLLSNSLGSDMQDSIAVLWHEGWYYYKEQDRKAAELYAGQKMPLGADFVLEAGLGGMAVSGFAPQYLPGAELAWLSSKNGKWYMAYSHRVRLPTFLDLYYVSYENMGNPRLKPEKARSAELGYKYKGRYFRASLAAFTRYGTDIIDWAWLQEDSLWQAMNVNTLNTTGLELYSRTYMSELFVVDMPVEYVDLNYYYAHADNESGQYPSKYAMDYLRQKASALFMVRISRGVSAAVNVVFQDRDGSFYDMQKGTEEDYDPFYLLNVRVNWERPMGRHLFTVFMQADNVTNSRYYDIGNIPMPGIWLYAGLGLRLDGD